MLGFLVGGYLTWKWSPKFDVPRAKIEELIVWILVGTVIGARGYVLVQNDLGAYLREPWRMLAVWEGGLVLFSVLRFFFFFFRGDVDLVGLGLKNAQ